MNKRKKILITVVIILLLSIFVPLSLSLNQFNFTFNQPTFFHLKQTYNAQQGEISFVSINGGLNESVTTDSTPVFVWNAVQNKSVYWLQISRDKTFTNLVVNISNITSFFYPDYFLTDGSTVEFTLPDTNKLPSYGDYYIRVRSYFRTV